MYEWDWEGSEREYRRAIALDPGYVTAHYLLALRLQHELRHDEAIAEVEAARAVDPLAPQVLNLAGFVYSRANRADRLDRGIMYLREALALSPQNDISHQFLGHALLLKGMVTEAIAEFEQAVALSGVRDLPHLAYAHAVAGNRAEAERIVRELSDPAAHSYLPPFHMAVAYVGLGDSDEAFRWLDRAYEEHASYMDSLQAMPYFAPLRTDPRWDALLRRMGLSR